MIKKTIISIAAVLVITGIIIVSIYIRNVAIQEKYADALSEGVAMFINDEAVYKKEFDTLLVPLYGRYIGDELKEKRAKAVFDLIDRRLLVQIADEKHIIVIDEEVEEMFNTNMNIANEDKQAWNLIQSYINSSGITLDEYYDKSRDVYKMTLRIQNLIKQTYEEGVKKGTYSETFTKNMINETVRSDLLEDKKNKSKIVYLMDEYKPSSNVKE